MVLNKLDFFSRYPTIDLDFTSAKCLLEPVKNVCVEPSFSIECCPCLLLYLIHDLITEKTTRRKHNFDLYLEDDVMDLLEIVSRVLYSNTVMVEKFQPQQLVMKPQFVGLNCVQITSTGCKLYIRCKCQCCFQSVMISSHQ